MQLTGAALAAEALRRHGVEAVFSHQGPDLSDFRAACTDVGLRVVDTRHEQTAAFAAEGWAKVTRQPGVAVLQAGAGVTNALSAVTSAHSGGTPMVLLSGRGSLDQRGVLAPVTCATARATRVDDVPAEVDAALAAASAPPRGPAFADLPLDASFGRAAGPGTAGSPAPPRSDPDGGDLAGAARLLAEAERPVLLAGSGVYWAGAEGALRSLAEEADLPVVMQGLGRGTLPADHPCAFSRARSAAMRETDLVLVAGTPLDFRLSYGQFGKAGVVHLCEDPSQVAGHVSLAGAVAGDLRVIFGGLAEAGRRRRNDWLERLRDEEVNRREAERATLQASDTPVKPARVMGEVRARLDRDAIVIGDGGDFVSYAGRYVDTYEPGCFLDPGPFGCLGTGMGYALGAALARPGRQVVVLLGDGAAGFSLMDFETLARLGLPVVVVVGNNGIWALERVHMRQFFGYDVIAELAPGTRYDEVARALGGHGELVSDPEAIGPALDRALAATGVPSLVNVLTDPDDVYPRATVLA